MESISRRRFVSTGHGLNIEIQECFLRMKSVLDFIVRFWFIRFSRRTIPEMEWDNYNTETREETLPIWRSSSKICMHANVPPFMGEGNPGGAPSKCQDRRVSYCCRGDRGSISSARSRQPKISQSRNHWDTSLQRSEKAEKMLFQALPIFQCRRPWIMHIDLLGESLTRVGWNFIFDNLSM